MLSSLQVLNMSSFSTYGPKDTVIEDALDIGFKGFNNRLRPDQLMNGMLSDSQNGRMDLNGEWQVRKGIELIKAPLAVESETLTYPFFYYANINSTSLSRASDVITIDFGSSHNFTTATLVNVTGITGITPDPNGNRIATVIDSDTITITITGLTGTIAGTATVGAPTYEADAVNAIYGSAYFSDPGDGASAYIILAANNKAVAVKISDGTTTDIDYPASTTISTSVELLQAFDKVYIFRDGVTALEWDGDLSGSPAFTLVANGAYTQPVLITAAGNTAVVNGLVTVTATAHGLTVGAVIRIIDGSASVLSSGDEYAVATVPGANSFTFFADIDDQTSHEVAYMKRQSVGLGFTHMPAPPWAIYHQKRLVMPFNYTTTGSSGSPTITSRGTLDEVIASDVLDSDTYDQFYAQYRFNAGSADSIIACHSFSDDKLLVFNRSSIHIVINSEDLDEAKVQLLTDEIGCVARRSIIQVGSQVIFLSDNGVYGTNFIDLYNLRGNEVPLSEPIEGTIKTLNKSSWANSIGVYFDNRYYIAVPTGSSSVNNAILVYNFLNKEWESVDTVADDGWEISNMMVAGEDGERGVYVVNSFGGIHKLDERLDAVDRVVIGIGAVQQNLSIAGSMTTRMFTADSIGRKKWNSFEIHAESSDTNSSDFNITVETENIDATLSLGKLSTHNDGVLVASEDVSIRGRIGNERAYGAQMLINNTVGRPRIRAIKMSGMKTFRGLTKAE